MNQAEIPKATQKGSDLSKDSSVGREKRRLKIAFIGQKGLPASYGGVEHHVENLSAGLAEQGHHVEVFCRPYYSGDLESNPKIKKSSSGQYKYRGINLSLTNSIQTKHFDAISHSALSTLVAARNGFDIVHYHGIGPSLVSFIPGIFGKRVVSTVHALDFRQKKWGTFAKLALKAGMNCAVKFPQKTICVSRTIQKYLGNPKSAVFIPNGVKEPLPWGNNEIEWIKSRGLIPGEYILFVGRLIEDKKCHLLSEAVHRIGGVKLAVAGDSSFTDDYVTRLKGDAGSETIFLGSVYNEQLSALYANCKLFVLPSSVEGLPIVLIEALKHNAPVLASDIPENLEVLNGHPENKEIGLTFKNGDINLLEKNIRLALNNPQRLKKNVENGYQYVNDTYGWNSIVRKTEEVYFEALEASNR